MTSLLSVEHLDVDYGSGRGRQRAVHDISLTIEPGETLGVLGESGSGKSTVGRAILGLVPVAGGSITFDGRNITRADRGERRRLASEIQVVFQDPRSSLNEVKRIGDILAEPLIVQRSLTAAQARDRAAGLLVQVGLEPDALDRRPGEFSGGQRQRIAIARALMPRPRLIVCDEPVSALDLSVQAQIINLFRSIQRETGTSYLFVAHDLAVVKLLSNNVLVMSKGRAVEHGPVDEVYTNPAHPYTRRLIAAEPSPDPDVQHNRRRAWEALANATPDV